MIDMTAGICPRCGGRLYVDTQYPDETHCETCTYPDRVETKNSAYEED